MLIRGRGLTTDMERINSQHFTVHMNCQSPIIDPGGGGLKTMQPHYLRAKHGVATSACWKLVHANNNDTIEWSRVQYRFNKTFKTEVSNPDPNFRDIYKIEDAFWTTFYLWVNSQKQATWTKWFICIVTNA